MLRASSGSCSPWHSRAVSVEDPGLHPLNDAIGRLVVRVAGMELWIYMARSHLSTDCTYLVAESWGPSKCLRELAGLIEPLPDAEREKAQAGLRTAAEVLEVRNAVVHDVLLPNHDDTVLESQRPDQRQRKIPEHRWKRVRFSRESLLADVERARRVSGLLQVNMTGWAGLLGLEDDGDEDWELNWQEYQD